MSALFVGMDERLAIASMPIVDARTELAVEERGVVARVAESRLREYSTGRLLARGLLRGFGAPHPVVTQCPDRSPRWPAGFVGSIAHTDRRCVVAVARETEFAAVGIDLEPAQGLERDLFETIATEDELAVIASLPPREHGLAVRRLFTAKEAAYKCVHPLLKVFVDFQEIAVEFAPDGARFGTTIAHPLADGLELEGHFVEHDGCFHAVVVLAAREAMRSS